MFDWTKVTKNPIDVDTTNKMLNYIKNKREVLCKTYRDYLFDEIRDKKVLDIGVVEHSIEHMESDGWLHKKIVENSSYCIGVDIVSDLVNILNERGYNVKDVDATSDIYIGEKFDVVVIGDVIEHVNNPIKLLEFAKRHLNENGKIIVSTPNVFYYKNVLQVLTKSTYIANFEHTMWITPSMALEMARRSGLMLDSYKLFSKCHRFPEGFLEKKFPELLKDKLCFIFKLN